MEEPKKRKGQKKNSSLKKKPFLKNNLPPCPSYTPKKLKLVSPNFKRVVCASSIA